ncbi:MAG: TolC family protein [candidate division Zixibacteria bacterium]|nr:TolC family protein [candidate division Zixibacteria bacterium]
MRSILTINFFVLILLFTFSSVFAQEITLEETLTRLLDSSTRGQIIKGQFEVSEAKFNAEKIGYYLPEISLKSTIPSITEFERFGRIGSIQDPLVYTSRTSSRLSNIELKQKIVTGGDLSITGNYVWSDYKAPNQFVYTDGQYIVPSRTKTTGSNIRLALSHPIFNTSSTRSAYNSARDNLQQAQIQWLVDQAELKKEGVTKYIDLLVADLDKDIAKNNSMKADIVTHWDSVMYADSVLTEEKYVESKSDRLEKKLALYDTEASYEEKLSEFKHILDLKASQAVTLSVPSTPALPTASRTQWLKANAEFSSETLLAKKKMEISERELKNTRTGGGLNGSVNLSYEIGDEETDYSKTLVIPEQNVDTTFTSFTKNPTSDWRISLELSYPLWDGGASKANVRSSELAYESSRLEYLAAQRNAKTKMEIAIKRMEINSSKLQLLEDELVLAEKKLQDAQDKFEEGIISESTLLENRVYYLEAAKSRLTTLKNYYHDLIDLEKTETP